MATKEELIRHLATKYNQPVAEIRKAVNSQFKFAAQQMKLMQEVRIPYFGAFTINKKRKEKLDEINSKTRDRKSKKSN